MKITIVQGAFLPVPPLRGGAVEKVWFALGQEFARRGHQVIHISRSFESLPQKEVIGQVQHYRLAGFDAPKRLAHLKLLDLVYSLRVSHHLPKADILVTNTFWLPLLIRCSRWGQLYVHVARYPKGQMGFYGRAARLQTVSEPIAQAILRQAPHLADKVRSIPYPVIDPSPLPESQQPRLPLILFVGRIHPEKGLHLLIEAFKKMTDAAGPQWRLAIVGPSDIDAGGGGPDYLAELKAAALPVADRVDWVGPIFDPVQLREQYYRKASLFVYPSLADNGETFGLAPLEAMAQGCPPLVSQLDCFADFIVDEDNGFSFNHRHPQPARVLTTKLRELVRNPERLHAVGQRALATSANYQLEVIATRYLEDFQSLLPPS